FIKNQPQQPSCGEICYDESEKSSPHVDSNFLRLLDVAPVGAQAHFGDYGDAEFGDVFHFVLDQRAEFFGLGGEDVEEEFVVDLQRHARTQVAFGDGCVDAEHGELDEVGGGALQRC